MDPSHRSGWASDRSRNCVHKVIQTYPARAQSHPCGDSISLFLLAWFCHHTVFFFLGGLKTVLFSRIACLLHPAAMSDTEDRVRGLYTAPTNCWHA